MRLAKHPIWILAIFGFALFFSLQVMGSATSPVAGWIGEAKRLLESGNYRELLGHVQQNLVRESDAGIRCDAYLLAAGASQRLGFHNDAADQLENARNAAIVSGDEIRQTLVRLRLSDLYFTLGRIESGEELAYQALQAATDIGQPALLAAALNNWGNTLVLFGDMHDAVDAYMEALEQNGIAASTEIRTRLNLIRAAGITGDFSAAITNLKQVTGEVEAVTDSFARASLMISTALTALDLLSNPGSGNSASSVIPIASKLLVDADTIAASSEDSRLKSMSRGHLGGLYESQGHHDEALRLSNSAIFYAQQGDHSDLLYQWQWQAGRALRAANREDDAAVMFEAAVATLGPIRNDLTTGYRQSGHIFESRIKPVYYELAGLYIDQAVKEADAEKKQKFLRQACGAVEKLKSAELEDYFQDECVAALQQKRRSLDSLTLRSAAVLYPMILADCLVTLVLYPDGSIQHYSQSVHAETVRNEVLRLRRELQSRSTKLFMYPARQLYDWIIRPAEAEFERAAISTLVIVPDGVLRVIPIATLHDGEQFLAVRYSVATTPSLSLTDPQPLRRDEISVMIAGLSHGVQGYSALPSVPRELKEIQQVMGGEMILNNDFSAGRVNSKLKSVPYRIMHLATHGEFGHHPEDTYLLTYDSKLTMDKLESLIKLGQFRDEPLELLTLSACRTAVGDEKSALGLAGVAVKSGARSAIATLWYVNDEATMIAITEFYRQLKNFPELSKAEALQNAQKKLIANDRYWHPAYWGPFLLVGNWL